MEQERQHRMRGIINTAADALILGLLFLSAVLSIYTAIAVFPLNPYWIELLGDYSGGFVRRFLLGEILNNIPGVPPAAAGLTVLTACYVFVTASLYAGVRRLNLPLFLRILVLLSPSGVASYILVPNQAIFFLSRDILIIAIVILSVRAACFVRNNADRAGPVLLGDFALCALVTFRNFILHPASAPDVPWIRQPAPEITGACGSARHDFPRRIPDSKPGLR